MCAAIADELRRCGLRHAVLSPGSRSTPLALALARTPGVEIQVVVDERSAAFMALGMAKESKLPAAVVSTSGTAAANFLPAVVEASYARVPLLVMTADRPPELRETGAGQTIDQMKLYGGFARSFTEVGVPEDRDEAPPYWRSLAARAFHLSMRAPQGPVHLNFAFREPLVDDAGAEGAARAAGRGTGPWMRELRPLRSLHDSDADELAGAIGGYQRGLIIIAGKEVSADRVHVLGERAAWPVLADVLSGGRIESAVTTYEALMRSKRFADVHRPDVVLQFGTITTSPMLARLAGSAAIRVVVDPGGAWSDPERNASWFMQADASEVCAALIARLPRRSQSNWSGSWSRAERTARAALAAALAEDEGLSEPFLARELTRMLPAETRLIVSSSMPVRDLDWFGLPRADLRVLANRGANGIDGFVSTAAGVALASGAPAVAFAGDLALLHDHGGLAAAARAGASLVVVVVNNDGGGIFSFLPQRDLAEFEPLFATPQDADFETLAAASQCAYRPVATRADLAPAVEAGLSRGGVSLVEVRTDRDDNVVRHRRLWQAVDAALSGAPPV